MSRLPLILVGAGGHARACIDVIESHGGFDIIGLVGLDDERGMQVLGYNVVATDADLPALVAQYGHALVTAGQIRSPVLRRSLYGNLVEVGCQIPVITASSAYLSKHATVGDGTIIMHGAIVNAGAKIGRNCIINTGAIVEHGAFIGDHCHISTGAILNGDVRVGDGTFIGSRSVLKQGLVVGPECVVGMGLTLRRDLVEGTLFTGLHHQ